MPVTIIVNDVPREVADDDSTLLSALRDQLGITGPKFGCGEGECRACTVLIGRRAVPACQTPVREAAGQRVTTAEGLAQDGYLHPVQQAWLECGAMQCGYCTPGWLTATAALLARVPHPSDERIAAELTNVCRCCTYPRIQRAVHRAAELLDDPEQWQPVPDGDVSPARAADPAVIDHPWDLARERPESFAAAMADGLLAVVTSDGLAEAGRPPRAQRRLGARGRGRRGHRVHGQGGVRPGHPDGAGHAGRRGADRAGGLGHHRHGRHQHIAL